MPAPRASRSLIPSSRFFAAAFQFEKLRFLFPQEPFAPQQATIGFTEPSLGFGNATEAGQIRQLGSREAKFRSKNGTLGFQNAPLCFVTPPFPVPEATIDFS
jgi:hypothetical protein